MKLSSLGAIAILLLITFFTIVNAQSLTWLGTLPNGFTSEATDVSSDGSIIVGTSDDGSGNTKAVVWDAYGSITDLGTLGGSQSYAYGVSGNGGTIVGKSSSNLSPNRAFKYFSNTMIDLGSFNGNISSDCLAKDASSDGQIIIGNSGYDGAVIWKSNGIIQIESLGNNNQNEPFRISSNDSVVVGWAWNGTFYQAYKWSETTGIQKLNIGGETSCAFDVSFDGSEICGMVYLPDSSGTDRPIAFKWDAVNSTNLIGNNLGFESQARGISDDGNIIVGDFTIYDNGYENHAFIYTNDVVQDLNEVFRNQLVNNSVLQFANAISKNGHFVVGKGYNASSGRQEAFVLDINILTGVKNQNTFSSNEFLIEQNYPNPFNPSTKISWQSPVGGHQTLKIYDVLGKEVATLMNEEKPAGVYEVDYNASSLSSGIYFYKLNFGSFTETKKMLLLK